MLTERLPLELVKAHLGVSGDDQDGLIQFYLKGAISQIEAYLKYPLIQRELTHTSRPMDGEIILPKDRIQEVLSVEKFTGEGLELVNQSFWKFDIDRVYVRVLNEWTNEGGRRDAKYKVTYKAGGWESEQDIPDDILGAILKQVHRDFYHRGDGLEKEIGIELYGFVKEILNPHKLMEI